MRKRIGSKDYLLSIISVDARLLTSLDSIRDVLGRYPGFSALKSKDADRLRYLVRGETDGHFYTVELGKERVSIKIHSISSPLYFADEALVRLLSTASYLGSDYEIDMRSL